MRRHQDPEGIIGSRPATDLGPLFERVTVPEAEKEIVEDFISPPPKARDETAAFDRASIDHHAAVERIQREVREPLIALALARKDSTEKDRIGITAADARKIADDRGLTPLLGTQQRAWSWLSPWLAELCRSRLLIKYRIAGMTVKRMADNGNDQVVYLHPYDYRARGAA